MTVRVLIEGRPGSGKTTAARRLVALLRTRGVPVHGFTTEELREEGRRSGFAVETVDGNRGVLAHVDLAGPPRVGRYGVDVLAFERIALPSLEDPGAASVVVIDELGRMELASVAFRVAVQHVFDGPASLVATVHVRHDPFTDALKGRMEVIRLDGGNRDRLPHELADRLTSRRSQATARRSPGGPGRGGSRRSTR
jgi:nucleoside-triphosphatase